MSEEPDVVQLATAHAGWVATLAIGTWGIVLRALLGRHFRAADKMEKRLDDIQENLAVLGERLTVIECRSYQRRRSDPPEYSHEQS
jgi:hypothetical protein